MFALWRGTPDLPGDDRREAIRSIVKNDCKRMRDCSWVGRDPPIRYIPKVRGYTSIHRGLISALGLSSRFDCAQRAYALCSPRSPKVREFLRGPVSTPPRVRSQTYGTRGPEGPPHKIKRSYVRTKPCPKPARSPYYGDRTASSGANGQDRQGNSC